jgi:hypothetical protein
VQKSGAAALLLAIGCCFIIACAPRSSPEQEVRAVIEAAEIAAEARDHRALVALVSRNFTDGHGGDFNELSQRLRAYLVAHPSVRLATRTERVEFPYADMAVALVTVGTLSRDSTNDATENASSLFELAANLHTVELELQREGDDWKVTRAEWDSLVDR